MFKSVPDLPPSYEEIAHAHPTIPQQQIPSYHDTNTDASFSPSQYTGDVKTPMNNDYCHSSPSFNPRFNQSHCGGGVSIASCSSSSTFHSQQQKQEEGKERGKKRSSGHRKKRRESCTSFSSCLSSSSSSSSSLATPKKNTKSSCKHKSESIMHIKDVNTLLKWEEPFWEGKKFTMMTTNNKIQIHGDIDAKEVHFETTNALIEWKSNFLATKYLKMKTTNAKIDFQSKGQIHVKYDCKIESSNAKLIWEDIELRAKELDIITSNAAIYMNHLHVEKSLQVKTSNAPVELFITSSNPKIQVQVTTSNAPITLHMPKEFIGEFKLNTSGHQKSIIIQDPSNTITFDDDKKPTSRKGYKKKKNGGYLKATTSEGNITILFDS
ncbi:hypothetical protein BJ944DRAFT_265946 [Cunninghamella echinulata]|nr:hypothetical protein BJ944DRAFT_265946 [Cunninghamella echinulata]